MAFLDEFTANFNKYGGPAFLNRFSVEIISPGAANPDISQDRFVSFKVVNVTLPGKNIRTVPNENVYGPSYQMAQGLTYAETISMNFYLSAQHVERTYFLNWMDVIIDPETYNLEYYNEYSRTINLFQLDKSDEKTGGLRLTECYPKTIGPIEYSQSSTEVGQVQIDFVFKEHFPIDKNGGMINTGYNPVTSTTRPSTRAISSSQFGALDFDF